MSDRPAAALTAVVGEECTWCGTASLREREYKGDAALVCPDCGTPALRLF